MAWVQCMDTRPRSRPSVRAWQTAMRSVVSPQAAAAQGGSGRSTLSLEAPPGPHSVLQILGAASESQPDIAFPCQACGLCIWRRGHRRPGGFRWKPRRTAQLAQDRVRGAGDLLHCSSLHAHVHSSTVQCIVEVVRFVRTGNLRQPQADDPQRSATINVRTESVLQLQAGDLL